MDVVCAWCINERGRGPSLRTIDSAGDAEVTHGICNEHALELFLGAFHARQQAVGACQLLLLAKRERTDLLEWLAKAADGAADVVVVPDRRERERRCRVLPVVVDRRRSERRQRTESAALDAIGWTGVLCSA